MRPELEKPFFIFKDAKENPKKYFKKIEPVDYPFLSTKTLTLAMRNPTWLDKVDDFRTYTRQERDYLQMVDTESSRFLSM